MPAGRVFRQHNNQQRQRLPRRGNANLLGTTPIAAPLDSSYGQGGNRRKQIDNARQRRRWPYERVALHLRADDDILDPGTPVVTPWVPIIQAAPLQFALAASAVFAGLTPGLAPDIVQPYAPTIQTVTPAVVAPTPVVAYAAPSQPVAAVVAPWVPVVQSVVPALVPVRAGSVVGAILPAAPTYAPVVATATAKVPPATTAAAYSAPAQPTVTANTPYVAVVTMQAGRVAAVQLVRWQGLTPPPVLAYVAQTAGAALPPPPIRTAAYSAPSQPVVAPAQPYVPVTIGRAVAVARQALSHILGLTPGTPPPLTGGPGIVTITHSVGPGPETGHGLATGSGDALLSTGGEVTGTLDGRGSVDQAIGR